MHDVELTELLSLADEQHEAPAGFRDELLAELQESLSEQGSTPDPSNLAFLGVASEAGDDDVAEVDLRVDDSVVRALEPRRRGRPRALVALGVAAAAAAIVIVTISGDPPRDVVDSGPAGPSLDEPSEVVQPDLSTRSDDEVCQELAALALESGFVGAERTELTSEQLGQLSELLVEMDGRGLLEADPTDAVGALAYAQVTAEQDAADAKAAYVRARSSVVQLRLAGLTCELAADGS